MENLEKRSQLYQEVVQLVQGKQQLLPVPSNMTIDLRGYQQTGFNWLYALYKLNVGGILGDEMGLGKTAQAISMLQQLHNDGVRGPYLVVAPLSVVQNWADELHKFAPKLKTFVYIGDKTTREQLRQEIVDHILSLPADQRSDPVLPFSVLVTSLDMVTNDVEFLRRFQWRYMVVDEAHRLKNPDSVLYRTLREEYNIKAVSLLTGTPLQNNIAEFWALLHFAAPKVFTDLTEFQQAHDEKKLSDIVRPFLLRRTKADVAQDIPEIKEILLYTGMSSMQKKYYRMILERDAASLGSANRSGLMNIVSGLRKACNHPYMFVGAEPEPFTLGEHIIENSGKLSLLDKLLKKLNADGHKVLVFSQSVEMLDIIQDYLHYRYERLDGSVRGEERYMAIKNFNEDSASFVFLLSTRAGGLGLNLTSADTVIFVDSDWNPQMDLQAMARAHRIGQKRAVKVFRLVAENTIDEVILRRAMRKLKLAEDVIEKGRLGADTTATDELKSMITYGLKGIWDDENSSIKDQDIDAVLRDAKDIDSLVQVARPSATSKADEEPSTSNELYVFEGKDFLAARKEDEDVLDRIAALAIKASNDSNTPRRRGAPAQDQIMGDGDEPRTRQAMVKRPKTVNLKSMTVVSDNNDFEADDTDEDEDSQGLESTSTEDKLKYVVGDVTKPIHKGPAIIVSCSDDSGRWGSGGLFTVIANKFPAAVEGYEKKAREPGTVLLVPLGDDLYMAHVIAQHRGHQGVSGILYDPLRKALVRVAQAAKILKASVHCPRIGAGTPSFNWYAVEKLLKKTIAARNIPISVYYFKRHGPSKALQLPFASPTQPSAPLVRIPSVASFVSADYQTISTNLQSMLPDIFDQCTVRILASETHRWTRYIVAYGGDVVNYVTAATTHIVADEWTEDVQNLLLKFPHLFAVSPAWVEESVLQRRLADPRDHALNP